MFEKEVGCARQQQGKGSVRDSLLGQDVRGFSSPMKLLEQVAGIRGSWSARCLLEGGRNQRKVARASSRCSG